MEDYIGVLSTDRLKSYEILCPSRIEGDIIGAYHWNLLISQALYPFIHSVEIALRNSIHQAATKRFDTEFWFDIVVTEGKSKAILDDTKRDLNCRFECVTASDIIASLTFGFVESFKNNCTLEVLEDYKAKGNEVLQQLAD